MILVPMESTSFDPYWSRLAQLGCSHETTDLHTSHGHRQLYSVDVPSETDIDAARAVLEQGDADGVWIFQEGNIEHRSRQEGACEPIS